MTLKPINLNSFIIYSDNRLSETYITDIIATQLESAINRYEDHETCTFHRLDEETRIAVLNNPYHNWNRCGFNDIIWVDEIDIRERVELEVTGILFSNRHELTTLYHLLPNPSISRCMGYGDDGYLFVNKGKYEKVNHRDFTPIRINW